MPVISFEPFEPMRQRLQKIIRDCPKGAACAEATDQADMSACVSRGERGGAEAWILMCRVRVCEQSPAQV